MEEVVLFGVGPDAGQIAEDGIYLCEDMHTNG